MEKTIKLYVADGNFAEAGIAVDVDDLCRIVIRRAGNRYACKRGALGRLHPEAAGDDQHQLTESAVQIDGAVFAEMLTFLKINGQTAEAHVRTAAAQRGQEDGVVVLAEGCVAVKEIAGAGAVLFFAAAVSGGVEGKAAAVVRAVFRLAKSVHQQTAAEQQQKNRQKKKNWNL